MYCKLNSQSWHKKVNFKLFTAVIENIQHLFGTIAMMSTLFKNMGKKENQLGEQGRTKKKSISSF